ncbi:GNAT family N-acetyltransferase [Cohnella hongkongensis]|uniref:GNAT family N-acetyltransferase n=1 Tax=Cohnella hongkongensis TaxID=178337 RepID=A0ABV9FGJ3_9BACL
MANIRLLQTADEREAAIRLADSVFRNERQISMGTAYPNVFSLSLGQSFGVFEKDRLVAFMGFVPAIVQIGKARLHIYSIGAVCTHAEARGKGYASRLMSAVIAHARASEASLILVSGHRALYERAGCYPFGSTKRYHLTAANVQEAASGIEVRKRLPTDLFRLTELAKARFSCYEQSLTDLAALIFSEAYASNVMFHHQVWVAEQGGQVKAFAVIAAPEEAGASESASARSPFVVEWAGDSEALYEIYAHTLGTGVWDRLQIQVNWYEQQLHEYFKSIPSETLANSGLIRLVDLRQLCVQLEPYLIERNRSASELERQLEPLDDERRIRALFDPPSSGHPGTDGLPLPFPYTVGLNYV